MLVHGLRPWKNSSIGISSVSRLMRYGRVVVLAHPIEKVLACTAKPRYRNRHGCPKPVLEDSTSSGATTDGITMAKVEQFEIDYGLVLKARKWLEKGAKMTAPTKTKPYTYTGRQRKDRVAMATNYEGAIQVGFAKTTNLREMRQKRDRYVGFWLTLLHFERAYQETHGVTPLRDNLLHGRNHVLKRARELNG
jgi:hypothetical protein